MRHNSLLLAFTALRLFYMRILITWRGRCAVRGHVQRQLGGRDVDVQLTAALRVAFDGREAFDMEDKYLRACVSNVCCQMYIVNRYFFLFNLKFFF